MKCPDCGAKITTKHYDAAYEWFECPKCEGCFTYDEIIEGGTDESSEPEATEGKGNRQSTQGKKAAGGRGKKRKNAGRKNGSVQAADAEIRSGLRKSGVVAKGKKRLTQIQEDEEAIAEFEKEILKPIETRREPKHHRDELDTMQVLGIWQDEIQDIYEELGSQIDEVNARDKALILWREIHIQMGATAREQSVEHALCGEHS